MDAVDGSAGSGAELREQLERLMPEGGRARRMVGWGVVAWAALGGIALVAVLFALVRQVAAVVPYLVMASMVVFVLNPAVERLAARGLSRRLAATLVFLAAVILTTVALSFLVPAVIRQAQSLGRSSPVLLRRGGGVFGRLSRSSNPLLRQAGGAIIGWIQAHAGTAPQALRTVSTAGLRLAHAGAVLLIGGFLGYLLLLSFSDTRRGLLALVPPAGRARFSAPLAEVRRIVGGYVRARLIVSAVVGVIATLGLWAVHMPFWLLLGIVVGVANLIPMLGSWIGGIPVALVALVTKPPSFLIVVLAVVTAAHLVDGFVLSPIVLKETTDLHPVVILLAVLLGAELLGFWGILAAIPVAGIANWSLRQWVLPRLRGVSPPAAASPLPPPEGDGGGGTG